MRSVVLVVLALPCVSGQPLIVGVVADLAGSADGEEAIALGSPTPFDASGFVLEDGEDAFVLPAGTTLAAGVPLWIVGNATAWAAFDGPSPVVAGLPLRLGNGGDDVCLNAPDGSLVDCFAFGSGRARGMDAVASTSVGLVYQRLPRDGGWVDTDSADDWRTPRQHRMGESMLPRPTFDVTRLTVYASPDSSFQVLTDLMSSATRRLHAHVYEFRSAALADALVAAKAAAPGLDLQVLVDGSPVGLDLEDRHEEADALRRVTEAGGQALLAGTQRYDHHHLKVLVADDTVAIQSENWVPSGVPREPSWGNRGWGVAIHDAALAVWFAAWMAGDRRAWDTRPFQLASFDPAFVAPPRLPDAVGTHAAVAAKTLTGHFRVTPVIAPDHTQDPASDPIALAAAAARRRLDVQQLDLALDASNALGWTGPDALATAIAAAASEGARARVHLAAPFSADDGGNAEAVAWLRERGIAAKLAGEDFVTLHNKGVLADDVVVVGSLNGNHHSRSENREVSVLLEGPGIAHYYGALFDADWEGHREGRDWSVPGRDLHALPATPYPTLLALTWLALLLRGRQ